MRGRYRKKPLAQHEHGTRIYAPSPSEARYRVVATDPVSGERIFVKLRTEDQARAKARELEQFIAQAARIRDPHDTGPGRSSVSPTATSMTTCRACQSDAGRSRSVSCAGGYSPHRHPHRDRLGPGRLRGGDRRGAPSRKLR